MGYWIVVVDDEPLSLTNAREILNNNGMKTSCMRSGKDLLKFMSKNNPDLILLDILMPEMDGFETYRALRQFEEDNGRKSLPVIFLTGENDSETESKGLKVGASDFIRKPFDKDILLKRINNTIANTKKIESLTEEATLDKLTGFLNKASGIARVSKLCKERAGALLILDLDNFKLVNDIYGHDMGDQILVSFSEILKARKKPKDEMSRIGGDEFMAFLGEASSEKDIEDFAKAINEDMVNEALRLMGEEHGIPLGISVGSVFVTDEENDYQILFQYADSALYKVKQNGKHGYAVYNSEEADEEIQENFEDEMTRVIQIVSERGEGKGAMLLGQDAFTWSYRFIVRDMKRYGGTANRTLFKIAADEKGVIFSEIAAQFGNVLKSSLRKSDIIFQCRPNQFFVVMPQLEENNVNDVINRIMNLWEQSGYKDKVRIEYISSNISFTDDGKGNRS